MDLVRELRLVTATREEAGVPYAVCGGLAVTIHGATRSTKDIDLLVREDDVETIAERLRPLGWRFRALPMRFDEGTPKERLLHRISKIEGRHVLVLDLLVVMPVFEEIWATRERVDLPDGHLTVVSREGLATMKRLAGRNQDLADLERLGLDDV